MRRRWWVFVAGSVGLAVVGSFAGPDSRSVATGILTIAAVAASAMWPGSRRRGGPVGYFSLGGVAFVGGVLVRLAIAVMTGVREPFPSAADPLFFLGWGLFIAGSVKLARARRAGPDQDALIDGLIVATGAAVVTWSLWLAPYLSDPTVPLLERTVNASYSLLTLTLLACCVRLAIGPGARTVSYYLLAGAVFLLGTTDLLTTVAMVGESPSSLPDRLAPWVWALFGAALTHPSIARLTEPPTEPAARLTPGRSAMLGVALMVPIGLVAYRQVDGGQELDWRIVVVGGAAMTALVLTRFVTLVRGQERLNDVQQILREANAALAAASSRHAMHRAALRAVLRLAGERPGLRASIVQIDGRNLRALDSMGDRAQQAVGVSVDLSVLPDEMVDAMAAQRTASIELAQPIDIAGRGGTASVLAVPFRSQSDLSGAIVVTSARSLPGTVRHNVETLASTVSLALESAVLTENLMRRRSERRFRALVENSSDIVLVVDEQRAITFASPAAHHLLGLSEKTLLGTHPARWVHPDDWPPLARAFSTGAGSGSGTDSAGTDPAPVEVRIRHIDGSHRWFEVAMRDLAHDPEIRGMVVTAREISDRKATEQQLAANEARFRALVQRSSDVVAVVDKTGLFTYLSPASSEMLGYEPEELVGTPVFGLMNPDDRVRFAASHPQFKRPLEPDELLSVPRVEVQLRHHDGGTRTVDITITDLREDPAVGDIVLNARDITVRKALEADLRFQALHDTLTGLPNRTMFTNQTTAAIAGAESSTTGPSLGALFIDLDDFKTVNDSLGHAVGDQLLQEVARRLVNSLTDKGMAARLGGDEFAVLVTNAPDDDGVVDLAEGVLALIAEPYRIQGRDIRVSASIGIAFATEEGVNAEVLLRNADVAMYLAKDRGKNRFAVFEAHMHTSVFDRLELKADLVRAIDDGQLRCYYQPIVSLQTGRMTGVEALVRWDHPTRGWLTPDAFIPLAEDTGLIVPLGRWVLREACEQLRAWQVQLPATSALSMSVNLSVRQLAHEHILEDVRAAVDDASLEPSTVTLEITETTLMHDTDVTRSTLAELRRIGVSLAVDDFGTGYSSLQYVQRFPIDIIKIDRSFITGLGTSAGDGAVVQSMIELSQRLGVHTVAEGIDRPEQVRLLRSLGADLGQGYLFSPPVPAEEIDRLLADGSRAPHFQLS